jgi:hypothetical protein
MSSNRLKVLLGVAGVLVALLIWNWISGWGLVTVHVQDQALSKIIRSIERQGGIKIVTNADLNTPITMDVDRVPPATAVDVLTAYIDGNWSVGYVAGPSKAEVVSGIAALAEGGRNRDFRTFGFGGGGFGGGGMMEISSTPVDARRVVWNVSPSDTPQLQSWLEQLSQKTGLMAMVPENWNPAVSKTPGGGKAASAVREIIHSVKGEYQEVFIIRVMDQERVADAGRDQGGNRPGSDGGFGGQRQGGGPGNGGRDLHPEWIAERAETRIAQLPADQRDQAKKDFDEMRAFWEKMRTLPDDQRRAAAEQFFNNPAVQDRMMERQMQRDAQRSPEKRAERFRRYVDYKKSVKASQ